jgi:hypothetical protein
MENRVFYQVLVQRYINGTATEEELESFFYLLRTGVLEEHLEASMNAESARLLAAPAVSPTKVKTIRRLRYWYAAATVLILISATIFFITKTKTQVAIVTPVASIVNNDPAPGSKKAILTLAGGETIFLNNGDRKVMSQGGTEVKDQGEVLQYKAGDKSGETILYNTVSTPRGGEYRLILADGTKVWLNAGTSLRYPTSFKGPQREVELTGEAYFEVTTNPSQPFVVKVQDGAAVKVLGTHFNIMSYKDEGFVKTTLAEGSVQLEKGFVKKVLLPGQGGVMPSGENTIVVNKADVDQDLAWKNGYFQFNKTDLQTILRQISRWYDLDIKYVGIIAKKRFVGQVSRDTKLSGLLKILESSDIHITTEGKTLLVKE